MAESEVTQENLDRQNNIIQALMVQRNNLADQLVLEQVKNAELSAQIEGLSNTKDKEDGNDT
tara:strand:+ start:206 stop:391 length:186 start_codon:yes stop_codon:yes gene_type:complete